MSATPADLRKAYAAFWKEKEWSRYVSGSLLADLHDVRRCNDIKSWIEENLKTWTVTEIEETNLKLLEIEHDIREESFENISSEWSSKIAAVQEVLQQCILILRNQWTYLSFCLCGTSETRNDNVFTYPEGMLAFWRLSYERRNKFIFLPGIQVEAMPFLNTLYVWKEYNEHMDVIVQKLREYDIGYLYKEKIDIDNDSAEEYEDRMPVIPTIKVPGKKAKKNPVKKNRTQLAKNFDELVKQTIQPKKQRQPIVNSRSPSRSPTKYPKALQSSSPKVNNKYVIEETSKENQGEHLVDFNQEAFLGPIYHIRIFDAGKKPKQCGAWLMHTETDLIDTHLEGKHLNITLKVPVEDVFISPNEPIIAYCEEGSNEWKKGVFTTHTQFDQNAFVMSTRLSKLGKVALFQTTDFHFPYRKWSVQFEGDRIFYNLHTHSVQLNFIIENNVLYLETQTGDEFSKLRSLHHKKMSLPEMAKQLFRHGVYLFASPEMLSKHKDTVKLLELEQYVYRVICTEQLSCQACRLNGSVAKDAALITYNNTQLHFSKRPGSGFIVSLPNDRSRQIDIGPSAVATLCRWLILTRPLSLTK